jgi:hypothetical protein
MRRWFSVFSSCHFRKNKVKDFACFSEII